MSLYDDLRKKLTPEQFTSVTDALGDDFNYDVVPRSRLNKVIKQRDVYKEQVELGTQHESDPELDDDDDDLPPARGGQKSGKPTSKAKPVDEAALRIQFEAEKATALQEQKIQFAALDKLRQMGAVDPELALSLLDLKTVKLENGALTGLDEQTTQLQTNKAFLFGKPAEGQRGTGRNGGEPAGGNATVTNKKDFLALSVEDQLKFKTDHPDIFKGFLD